MRKLYLVLITGLACLPLGMVAGCTQTPTSESDHPSAAIERIRAVLPQGWRIIEIRKGQVAPVYYVPGQGVEIFILRPHISPEEIKGVDITLHLMSLDYKGISTWQKGAQSNPSRFLGTTKSFKVYIHGGQGPTHGWENSESDLKQAIGISD